MSHLPIPLQLKELRLRAGLSVRGMATLLRRAPSTYGHYETPDRMKGEFLPMEIALEVAEVLQQHGIPRDEVMALAGPVEVAALEQPGFRESEAAPYSPRNAKGRDDIDTMMRIVAPNVKNPVAYKLSRDHHGLAMLEGDILVIDQGRTATNGQIVVATLADEQDGTAATVIRQFAGGGIVPQVGQHSRESALSAGIMGVVIALIRLSGTY